MFLSTFEGLRKSIINNRTIDSLLHLSRGVFGADFGASSVVISNTKVPMRVAFTFVSSNVPSKSSIKSILQFSLKRHC